MKFKFTKDNSETAYTKEMKQKEKELKELRQELREKNSEIANQRAVKKMSDRTRIVAYPNLREQLDMLWHDIDSGVITTDKQNPNSWYQKIKAVKEKFPNPKDRKTEPHLQNVRPHQGSAQHIVSHLKKDKS